MKKVLLAAACAISLIGCTGQKNAKDMDITGKWNIEKAMGVSTQTAERPTYIIFDKDGKVNGCASVNVFSGEYALKGEKLTLSYIGMTKMMGASMDVEDAVTNAINTTASIKVKGDNAYILNAKNDTIMVLSKEK